MKRILFQGDSITDVDRNRQHPDATNGMGCGYPLLIKARLNCDHPGAYECLNLGTGGHRVVDLYAGILRDFINVRPDILSILIGVNDVWHGMGENPNGVSAPKFERVYDWLLTEVRESLPQLRLIILEPFALPGTATQPNPAYWDTFSHEVALRAQAARRVAEKHGAIFVPLQDRLNALSQTAPCVHWLRDGVHPTEAGHEVIARAWMEAFESLAR